MSRQYVEISRGRIEGLITSFNRLIVDILKNDTDRQDTTIETESVRYLYQILDNITIVVITSKGSNVLEDLSTLSVCSKVIGAYCRSGSIQERDIINNFIDIVFAFDQIITPFGYKDNNHLTLGQIKSIVEMDSHDEKLAELNEEAKMRAAKSLAKQKAAELKEARDRAMKAGIAGRSISSADMMMPGAGAGASASSNGMGYASSLPISASSGPAPVSSQQQQQSMSNSAFSNVNSKPTGLVLGMKKPQSSLLSKIKEEEQLQNNILTSPEQQQQQQQEVSDSSDNSVTEDLHIIVNEGVSITALSDGSIESLEVKGELSVLASTPAAASAAIAVEGQNPNYQWKAHPQIDKARWGSEGVLVGRRPFPVGSPIAVLKWHMGAAGNVQEADVPLGVSCWPSPAPEGGLTVSIEYDMREGVRGLENVVVEIPCPNGESPQVSQVDGEGAQVVDGVLVWKVGRVGPQNASGSIEFEVRSVSDSQALFPVNVRFESVMPFSGIRMAGARMSDGSEEIKYSEQNNIRVVKYTIMDNNQ